LVESAEDVKNILEQLPPPRLMEPGNNDYNDGDAFDWKRASQTIEQAKPALLQLLSPILTSRDEIVRQTDLPIQIANAALLELELNGEIISDIDGRIALNL